VREGARCDVGGGVHHVVGWGVGMEMETGKRGRKGGGCGREVWSTMLAIANALLACGDCEVEVKRAVWEHLRQSHVEHRTSCQGD
jgi:hypothetical protein